MGLDQLAAIRALKTTQAPEEPTPKKESRPQGGGKGPRSSQGAGKGPRPTAATRRTPRDARGSRRGRDFAPATPVPQGIPQEPRSQASAEARRAGGPGAARPGPAA
ncbi:hypothetical protein G6F31_021253 [Rhizopus arrhizus]|nr:hypothetical protein G6F31_021253 [Rhizopus arrhizus]